MGDLIEQHARELLAAEYQREGFGLEANNIRRGRLVEERWNELALRAIRAALTRATKEAGDDA